VADEYQWRLVNGLWGLFLSFGFLLTSLWVRTARSWRFLNARLRGFLADYGVPLLVVVWAALSYAVQGVPEGVPRRMRIPNTWEVKDTWTVAAVRAAWLGWAGSGRVGLGPAWREAAAIIGCWPQITHPTTSVP
jgi:hypothetical protein